MEIPIWEILFSTAVVLVVGFFRRIYISVVIKPNKIRKILRQQGISGPPPNLLFGNLFEIRKARSAAAKAVVNHPHPPVIHNPSTVFPLLEQWRQQYGPLYMFSFGNMPILYASSPELVKVITSCTSADLGKPSYALKELGPLLGQGIGNSNGNIWALQRKIIAPLLMGQVKGMMDITTESALTVINSWKNMVENEEYRIIDITVDGYMKRFARDIICKTCFGSSYSKGVEIFAKFEALQDLLCKIRMSRKIPGLRYIPTKSNRETWALEKEISTMILKVVRERQHDGYKKDLLENLIEGAKSSYSSSNAINRFIVDNCKNIYFAGIETSAVTASWCLMLLGSYPEWQIRVRDEVAEVCQGRIPDRDMLGKMKQLTMVIQETMRLYPAAPTMAREALKDMKVGHILVPKGVTVWALVGLLHTDISIWGPDALEFKPQRFENGIAGACKNSNSYLPFGFGQHVCLGQQLAMAELKLLIALILTNFSFTLSPNYVHSPNITLVHKPKHGVQIVIKKL